MKPSIRCSSLPQLLACPGSRTLIARLAPGNDEGSAVTHEGNWVHWKVANDLIECQSAVGPDGGLPAPKIPANYKPGPFQLWMAQFCFDQALEGLRRLRRPARCRRVGSRPLDSRARLSRLR